MSGTGKRGADKLNIIGVVTVGICGAVLTYVSIILLEAFYMSDTSAIDQARANDAPGSLRKTTHDLALTHLDGSEGSTITIDKAMDLVVRDVQKDPSNLVPAVGPSTSPT